MTQTATVTDKMTYIQTQTATKTETDRVTMTEVSTMIEPTTYVSTYVSTEIQDNVSNISGSSDIRYLNHAICRPRRFSILSLLL